MVIDAGDDRAHRTLQTYAGKGIQTGHGPLERAGPIAEVIVNIGNGTVDTNTNTLKTDVLKPLGGGFIKQPSVGIH